MDNIKTDFCSTSHKTVLRMGTQQYHKAVTLLNFYSGGARFEYLKRTLSNLNNDFLGFPGESFEIRHSRFLPCPFKFIERVHPLITLGAK
jgi:hypothetical protein